MTCVIGSICVQTQKGDVMSIFQIIKSQILSNERNEEIGFLGNYNKCNSFVIKGKSYPQRAIVWLTDKKVFKVASVQELRDSNNRKIGFEITYKNLDIENEFFKFSQARTRRTKDSSDYRGYSSGRVDVTSYWSDENKYEFLEPEDSCTIQLMLQAMGYENYREFALINEGTTSLMEELYAQYVEFSSQLANEYQTQNASFEEYEEEYTY